MLNDTNDVTLQTYESGILEYVSNTAVETCDDEKRWIDKILALLPKTARILEIGSGFGKDARYIETQGYQVERTDAAEGFVNLLRQEGYSAHLFNVLTQDFTACYDLIFANAVFLHFTRFELEKVVNKIAANLTSQGLLAFSVKKGDGEEWTSVKLGSPRYFCYWRSESLNSVLKAAGYESLEISESQSFLQIIAKNRSRLGD